MFKAKKTDDDAVSPVIGVILLVAVTVALVALATVIVFDISSDVSDTADATVQLDQVDDTIQATVIRNENVASFAFSGADAATDEDFDGEGSVGQTATTESLSEDTTVSVIASLEDGSDEVLTSTDFNA